MAVLSSTANSIANKCINTVISQEHNKLLLLLLFVVVVVVVQSSIQISGLAGSVSSVVRICLKSC